MRRIWDKIVAGQSVKGADRQKLRTELEVKVGDERKTTALLRIDGWAGQSVAHGVCVSFLGPRDEISASISVSAEVARMLASILTELAQESERQRENIRNWQANAKARKAKPQVP